MRESLFSSLQDISELCVLDLFGGSGALSFESISRGAKEALIIEKSIQAYKIIKKNINNLEVKNITLIKADAIKYIKKIDKKFDLIFIDPPYEQVKLYNLALNEILKMDILNENAKIICEMKNNLNIKNDNLKIIKEKKYGSSKIVIFSKV